MDLKKNKMAISRRLYQREFESIFIEGDWEGTPSSMEINKQDREFRNEIEDKFALTHTGWGYLGFDEKIKIMYHFIVGSNLNEKNLNQKKYYSRVHIAKAGEKDSITDLEQFLLNNEFKEKLK